MVQSEIRQKIHKLIDEADENRLDTILEVLQPSSSRYSTKELDSFYNLMNSFDSNGGLGLSVKESHNLIREKFNK